MHKKAQSKICSEGVVMQTNVGCW